MASCSKCEYVNRPEAKRCGGCGAVMMEAGVGRAPQALQGGGPVRPTVHEGGAGGGAVPPTRLERGAQMGGAADPTRVEGHPGAGRYQQGAPNHTVFSEEAVRPIAGWLVVLRSLSLPLYKEIPIYMGANNLGRDAALGPHCVDDPNVSTQQALVQAEEGGVLLMNTSTTNPTQINRQPIRHAALNKGDEVRMGRTTMVFVPMPQGG